MYHWDSGLEIDMLDENANGMSLVLGLTGVRLYKVTNDSSTLFHEAAWDV